MRPLIFCILLLLSFSNFSILAQQDSKNYGSPEFEQFYESINEHFNNYTLKQAQLELDNYKATHLSKLDCNQKALLYHLQGSIYYSKENDIDALKYWVDSSLYYWNFCPVKSEYHYALIQSNIGNSYSYLNKIDSAKIYLDKATLLWEEIDDLDKAWHAGKLLTTASFFTLNDDGYNAELIYDRIENILPELNNKEVEAKFYKMKSLHNFATNSFEKAITIGNKAIKYYSTNKTQYYRDLIICYYNIANSHIDLNEYDKASLALDSMKELFENYGYNEQYKRYKNVRSVVDRRMRRFESAKKILESKIDDLKNSKPINSKMLSFAYENLADVYIDEGKIDDAMALYLQARDLYLPKNSTYQEVLQNDDQSFLHPINLAGCLNQIAKTKNLQYQSTGDIKYLNEASTIYQEIKIIFDRDRLSTFNEVKKSIASDRIKELYQEAVNTFVALYRKTNEIQHLETAYQYASTNKSLLQKEKSRNTKIFRKLLPDSLAKKEVYIIQDINSTYSKIQQNVDALKKDSLYSQLSLLQTEYETFAEQLAVNFPKYYAATYQDVNPLTITQVQDNMDQGELVLDYYFSTDSLYCFAISKHSIKLTTASNVSSIQTRINEARNNLEEGNETDGSLLKELYSTLIQPNISGDEKILRIIGDDQLLKLPFEALMHNNKYLIELYPISYLLSNTDLKKKESVSQYNAKYVGFGSEYSDQLNASLANVISKDFLPLSQLAKAGEEIQMSNSVWNGETFLDDQATKSNFFQNAQSASIVHLAMHGIINNKYPDQSAIIFDDRQSECILKVNEIYPLDMKNELVILSSCDSGSGKIYKAEGTQSLARGFAVAGSPSIVSSLWAAYDKPTSEIIAAFNKNLSEGMKKDFALQQAKIKYLKTAFPTLKAPKYWSNIVLIGNTAPMSISSGSKSWLFVFLGVSLLVILIFAIRRNKNKKA